MELVTEAHLSESSLVDLVLEKNFNLTRSPEAERQVFIEYNLDDYEFVDTKMCIEWCLPENAVLLNCCLEQITWLQTSEVSGHIVNLF